MNIFPVSSSWNPNLYSKALFFAVNAHHGQLIKGTSLPYMVHLVGVCAEVKAALQHRGNLNGDLAVQCALLHDVLEDTSVSYDVLAQEFGVAVANGVVALTKNEALPKEAQMADSLERIRQQPAEVWLVKLADRINNLRKPPMHWGKDKVLVYMQEAKVILGQLGDADAYLRQRLQQKIEEYGQYL